MLIRAAGPEDADAVYELLVERSRAAFGVVGIDRADVERELARRETDCFIADGGYAHLRAGHQILVSAADARVGDALLARAEQRARERGFTTVEITAMRADAPLWALAARSGYRVDREVIRMWRSLRGDLPEPVWPDGVSLRTYADADAHAVHTLLDEAYGGWDERYLPLGHDAWLDFMTNHEDFDPSMWFLVERDGALVACALCWRESRKLGWVKDLVVRESERGTGIGKALLHHAFREYAKRGGERIGLKMESTNPTAARPLYERVGFVVDQTSSTWVKDL